MTMSLARIWGFDDPSLAYSEKIRIASSAARQIAYDYGYQKEPVATTVMKWGTKLDEGVLDGTTNPLHANHSGPTAVTDKLEEEHPGYLHFLYRYTMSVIGAKGTFDEITEIMNERSNTPVELRPSLNLHSKQVQRWWTKNKEHLG